MAILKLLLTSSGQEWQLSHFYWHLSDQEWQFYILLLTSTGQQWQLSIVTDIHWSRMAIFYYYWHLVVNNGSCLLLTSIGQEWQFNLTFLLTSSGQEWQFDIATNIPWSRMAILNLYWHWVVKNGNFILLLTSSCQRWLLSIATNIHWSRMVMSHCYYIHWSRMAISLFY